MNIFQLLIKYRRNLLKRDFILELFTEIERINIDNLSTYEDLYDGQIVTYSSELCYFDKNQNKPVAIYEPNTPLLNVSDRFKIKSNDIENYIDSTELETSVGLFIINYILIASVFKNLIPYINKVTSRSKIEDAVVQLAMNNRIQVIDSHNYYARLGYIRQFANIFIPSLSSACITPSKIVLAEKDRLLKLNKDKLEDPVVLTQIEDQLIAMLKEELKNDPSYRFLGSSGKLINNCIKKMLIAGGVTIYQEGNKTKYKFIANSLDQEWDTKDFATYTNEVRVGIAGRALSTAEGGVMVNYLQRCFMDAAIVMDNCGTTDGFMASLTENNYSSYIDQNVINKDGSTTPLSNLNKSQYINKTILLRSPMKCKAKTGYCSKCMGFLNEIRETETIASVVSRIGSQILSKSMAAFHHTKTQVLQLDKLNQFTS